MSEGAVRIGPYRLLGLAGTGGMGAVYAAAADEQGARVALKLLVTGGSWRALQHEVRATAALSHPRVVRVLDFGQVDRDLVLEDGRAVAAGTRWLATEWVGGGSLVTLEVRDWAALRAVLSGVLEGLAHVHARDLIHRDLKPGNLLLESAVAPGSVKVADLGISAHLGESPGEIRGTPTYMAPEQAAGHRLGPETDLYALGVVAWELATGSVPYDGPDAHVVLAKHVRGKLPVFTAGFSVPPDFEAWLRLLLARDPADRFRWAVDAARALRDLGDVTSGGLAPSLPPRALRRTTPTFSLDIEPLTLDRGEGATVQEAVALDPLPERGPDVEERSADLDLGWTGRVLFGHRPVPIVGRDVEREALWAALRDVEATRSARVVLLESDPGCGATTLATWLRHGARECGWYGWGVTLRPGDDAVARLVGERFGVEHLDAGELRAALEAGDAEGEDVEWLLALLAPAATRAPLEDLRQRLEVAARALESAARERPTVLVLDEIHHDPGAVRLAARLLAVRYPLLVVLTMRSDAVAADVRAAADRLRGQDGFSAVRLGPLDEDRLAVMLRRSLGIAGPAASRLAERSGGNPEFLVQLVGLCLERGWLVREGPGWGLDPAARLALPDSIARTWDDRVTAALARGPGVDPAPLELAAILGQHVAGPIWARACRIAGVEPDLRWVDVLLAERLAVATDGDPGRAWSFAHPSVQEALVARAATSDRAARWHLACAAALEGVEDAEGSAGEHLAQAGRWREATALLTRAAERAGASSNTTVWRLLQRAEQAADRAELPVDDPHRVRLWGARGAASQLHGDAAGVERSWQAFMDLLGPNGSPVDRAQGWVALGQSARRRGETSQALGRFAEAEGVLDPNDPAHASAWLLTRKNTASLLAELGRFDEARAVLEEDLSSPALQGSGAIHAHVSTLGQVMLGLGRAEEARELLERAREANLRELRVRRAAEVENLLGDVARHQGRLDDAEHFYLSAIRRFRFVGALEVPVARANLALVRLERGRPDLAERDLLRAEAEMQAMGWMAMVGAMRVTRAACFARLGDWSAYDAAMSGGRPLVEQSGMQAPDLLDAVRWCAEAAEAAGEVDRAAAARSWLAALSG